jgi:hypothetical protein
VREAKGFDTIHIIFGWEIAEPCTISCGLELHLWINPIAAVSLADQETPAMPLP